MRACPADAWRIELLEDARLVRCAGALDHPNARLVLGESSALLAVGTRHSGVGSVSRYTEDFPVTLLRGLCLAPISVVPLAVPSGRREV